MLCCLGLPQVILAGSLAFDILDRCFPFYMSITHGVHYQWYGCDHCAIPDPFSTVFWGFRVLWLGLFYTLNPFLSSVIHDVSCQGWHLDIAVCLNIIAHQMSFTALTPPRLLLHAG